MNALGWTRFGADVLELLLMLFLLGFLTATTWGKGFMAILRRLSSFGAVGSVAIRSLCSLLLAFVARQHPGSSSVLAFGQFTKYMDAFGDLLLFASILLLCWGAIKYAGLPFTIGWKTFYVVLLVVDTALEATVIILDTHVSTRSDLQTLARNFRIGFTMVYLFGGLFLIGGLFCAWYESRSTARSWTGSAVKIWPIVAMVSFGAYAILRSLHAFSTLFLKSRPQEQVAMFITILRWLSLGLRDLTIFLMACAARALETADLDHYWRVMCSFTDPSPQWESWSDRNGVVHRWWHGQPKLRMPSLTRQGWASLRQFGWWQVRTAYEAEVDGSVRMRTVNTSVLRRTGWQFDWPEYPYSLSELDPDFFWPDTTQAGYRTVLIHN